ncbi:MAG: hypothetical protein AAGK17_13655 [Pseudomonadota bacterium]
MDFVTLAAAWKNKEKVPVPYFGSKKVELYFEDEEHLQESAPALLRFFSLTTADRDASSHHAYAYFRDFADEVGFDEGWIELAMEKLTEASPAIWDFVYPGEISAKRAWDFGKRDVFAIYVVANAECGWEEEHGFQMSWRNGVDVARVGDHGHATNGHAYNDPAKDAFVYYSHNAPYCTRNPLFPKD